LRFLVRLHAENVSRETLLASVRALAASLGAQARNPKWTSYGALEVDIFCPTKNDFELFLAAVTPVYTVEFSHDLNEAPPHKSDDAIFSEAIDFFNRERYWESHETLEGLWRAKTGDEKRYLQGLILVCAAFVHHQKGEEPVAMSVLKRASRQLDYPTPEYRGLKVKGLARKVDGILSSGEFSVFRL
jgi:uncharacterized protein